MWPLGHTLLCLKWVIACERRGGQKRAELGRGGIEARRRSEEGERGGVVNAEKMMLVKRGEVRRESSRGGKEIKGASGIQPCSSRGRYRSAGYRSLLRDTRCSAVRNIPSRLSETPHSTAEKGVEAGWISAMVLRPGPKAVRRCACILSPRARRGEGVGLAAMRRQKQAQWQRQAHVIAVRVLGGVLAVHRGDVAATEHGPGGGGRCRC